MSQKQSVGKGAQRQIMLTGCEMDGGRFWRRPLFNCVSRKFCIIRGLTDEFSVAEKLSLGGLTFVTNSQMLISEDFPNITEAMKKEFDKDFLNFPPKNDLNTLENKSVLTYDLADAA
ncbi:hypothetical protein [Escherichia coli]|uniref:hypothetical protein n=1 Tax=Escherichia coli TaxID=562 RepID=UPI003F5CC002